MEKLKTGLCIVDELGCQWIFGGKRVRVVGDETDDGGYYADSCEDAVKVLKRRGYIPKLPGESRVAHIYHAEEAARRDEDGPCRSASTLRDHGIVIK